MAEQHPLPELATMNEALGYIYAGVSNWLEVNGSQREGIHIFDETYGALQLPHVPSTAPELSYCYDLPGERIKRLSPATNKLLEPQQLRLTYRPPHYMSLRGKNARYITPTMVITDKRSDSLYRDWEIYPEPTTEGGAVWGYMYEASPQLDTERRRTFDIHGLVGLTALLGSYDKQALEATAGVGGTLRRIFRRLGPR